MTITDIESFAIRKGFIKPEPCEHHQSKTGRRWGAHIAFVRDLAKRRKRISNRDIPMIPNRSKLLSWMWQHGELKIVGHHKKPHTTGMPFRIFEPTKRLTTNQKKNT